MSHIDERIERLISRQLDGELSDEEQLELNRELIRNPEAHRLMEEYKRVDDLAAEAIECAVGRSVPTAASVVPMRSQTVQLSRSHSGWRIWWLIPGSIAAALLALMVGRFTPTSPSSMVNRENGNRLQMGTDAPNYLASFPTDDQPRINRKTNRNGFGVVGEDGRVYWVEVDHVRTVTRPSPQTAAQLVSGGM